MRWRIGRTDWIGRCKTALDRSSLMSRFGKYCKRKHCLCLNDQISPCSFLSPVRAVISPFSPKEYVLQCRFSAEHA